MDDAETPLFVRLPPKIAARLDRAAFELGLSKKELVTALLSRHMDDDGPSEPERLRQLHDEVAHFRAVSDPHGKRKMLVTFMERADGGPAQDAGSGRGPFRSSVGNAAFRAFDAAEVLNLEEASELLQVEPRDLEALAAAGELPGRKIGESWRFARAAILRWLEHEPAG